MRIMSLIQQGSIKYRHACNKFRRTVFLSSPPWLRCCQMNMIIWCQFLFLRPKLWWIWVIWGLLPLAWYNMLPVSNLHCWIATGHFFFWLPPLRPTAADHPSPPCSTFCVFLCYCHHLHMLLHLIYKPSLQSSLPSVCWLHLQHPPPHVLLIPPLHMAKPPQSRPSNLIIMVTHLL